MIHLEFRVQQPYDFAPLADKFPGLVLSNWCNLDLDVLEIHNPDPSRWDAIEAELRRAARRGFKLVRPGAGDGTSRVVLTKCAHPHDLAIGSLLDAHDCLVLHPIVYRDGWKHYKAIAFDPDRVRSLLRAIKGVANFELLARRPASRPLFREAFFATSASLVGGLTHKQAEAVLASIDAGYYEFPRRTTFEAIARRRGVPKTTFEEHVRKGENRILRAVAPFLAAHVAAHTAPGTNGGRPRPRTLRAVAR